MSSFTSNRGRSIHLSHDSSACHGNKGSQFILEGVSIHKWWTWTLLAVWVGALSICLDRVIPQAVNGQNIIESLFASVEWASGEPQLQCKLEISENSPTAAQCTFFLYFLHTPTERVTTEGKRAGVQFIYQAAPPLSSPPWHIVTTLNRSSERLIGRPWLSCPESTLYKHTNDTRSHRTAVTKACCAG